MQHLKQFNIPNGEVLHTEHKTNHLFTKNIKEEYCISISYAEAKGFSPYNLLHHCYKGQPYDMTITGNGLPHNYEIKNDSRSIDTGNLFFEHYDGKAHSGYRMPTYEDIHFWLTLSGNNLYEFQAKALRDYLISYPQRSLTLWKEDKETGEKYISSIGDIVSIEKLEKLHFTNVYKIPNLDYNIVPDEYTTILR